jgi:hypothetical protein
MMEKQQKKKIGGETVQKDFILNLDWSSGREDKDNATLLEEMT